MALTATCRRRHRCTLDNVRNFRWQPSRPLHAAWETGSWIPNQMTSVDVFTSVWGNPLIAHIMVSFGFAGRAARGVFRRDPSARGAGLFRRSAASCGEFELILIAADERDVIHLRTDLRRRDGVAVPADAARRGSGEALFLGICRASATTWPPARAGTTR